MALRSKAWHFILASLLASLVTVIVLALAAPLFVWGAGGDLGNDSLARTIGASVLLIPFALALGLPIALAAAVGTGGLVLWLEQKFQTAFRAWQWISFGFLAGSIVSLFFGQNDPFQSRIVTLFYFGGGGALGAWIFRRTWIGKQA